MKEECMMKKVLNVVLVLALGVLVAGAQDIPKWKIGNLETYIKNTDKPTVVNFWATFCKPCIAEIPHFEKLVKQYEKDSVQLLLVSLDMEEMYPAKIQSFAGRFGFTAPIVYFAETNADIFCPRLIKNGLGPYLPVYLSITKTGTGNFLKKSCQNKNLKRN
jgi:thiol-disulfide isomerase/thioredoxin